MAEDRELVLRARQGDRSSLEALLRRHTRRVRACVIAVLGAREDLDDILQETMIRGMTRLSALREPEQVDAWLPGIARNLCRDRIRRKKTTRPFEEAESAVARPRVLARCR